MRTIVHLSDLHFGRIDQAIVEPLATTVTEIKPDVVVVSGDLTQRARSEQFQEAREFLDELPHPQIIVPGNHDVPLYNVFQRFLEPLDKYRRYITDDLEPFYSDEQIALLGTDGDGGSGDVRRGRVALRPPARQPHGTHGQALQDQRLLCARRAGGHGDLDARAR